MSEQRWQEEIWGKDWRTGGWESGTWSPREVLKPEGFRLEDFLLPCLASSELGELESGRAAGWGELQVGKVATGKGGRD